MAKVITKMGGCSTKKKGLGMQFLHDGSKATLGGSYTISGDSMVESPEEIPAVVDLHASFKSAGCKLCGNKFAYRCGGCGRLICYDGNAKTNEQCPLCGSRGNVPAFTGANVPSSSAARRTSGETVQLKQGQEVRIQFEDGSALNKIYVGVGWDPAVTGSSMDVDSSVIVAGGRNYEVVYFGDKDHPSGCVHHHGDNVTGDGDYGGDDENISVNLDKVPANRDKLYFVLNIYDCVARGQNFSKVRNMFIRIDDPDSGTHLIEYRLEPSMGNYTAMIIGVAYKSGSDWMFKAIGEGSHAVDISDLADEVVSRY